ncbi:MAG TPA: hypothetical protein VMT43_09680 [Acidimicrobiales bacterium]|nr:hypothetical protein [Acidimicrobiales bacterium]
MRDDAAASDEIRLVLPAEARYGRLARITVSNLARRLGFPARAVEDLRLAVDESIILLLRPEGRPGTITLVFRVGHTGIAVDATTTAGEDQYWVDQGALARFEAIVGETVDSYAVDEQGRHIHLVKHFT